MNVARLPLMLLIASMAMGNGFAGDIPDCFNERPGVINIQVSEDGLRSLRANNRKDVSTEVEVFGKKWRDVPMHLKGSGTFQSIDEKPSLTLQFGELKIHLNNSADDPSRFNEFIGSYIFTAAGMEVPKISHGVVTLNGRRLGLYVIKEGFKSPSIEVPSADVTTCDQLEHLVDVDSFCSFMALEVMICHWDGYSLRGNNFHSSRQPTTMRYSFEPAGMDQLFGKPDFNWKPDMTGPLARAVMNCPEGRGLYEKQFRRLFETVFDPKTLRAVVEQRVEEIRPILQATEFENLRGEASDLCERISQRHRYLQKALATRGNTENSALRGQRNAGL